MEEFDWQTPKHPVAREANQCFSQVENLLVVVGVAALRGMAWHDAW